MRKLIHTSLLLISLFAFAACGDDDSSTGAGFAGPDLSGTWTGMWGGGPVTMVLDQNGANVTGTLTRGRESFDLNGTVSATGVFSWGAVTPSTEDCISMASTRDDFQVSKQNTALSGVARRAEGLFGDSSNPCGSRTKVETGTMDLERAF